MTFFVQLKEDFLWFLQDFPRMLHFSRIFQTSFSFPDSTKNSRIFPGYCIFQDFPGPRAPWKKDRLNDSAATQTGPHTDTLLVYLSCYGQVRIFVVPINAVVPVYMPWQFKTGLIRPNDRVKELIVFTKDVRFLKIVHFWNYWKWKISTIWIKISMVILIQTTLF